MNDSLIAITREISPNIHLCELTHLDRQPIDYFTAVEQHNQYQLALAELGCRVIALPAEPALPDSVFVEDPALVLDEAAVILIPGADSRRPEADSLAAALQPYRRLLFMEPPATLDGGDVLRLGKTLYVGFSSRTNLEGFSQLGQLTAPFGYQVEGVPLHDCLHLKSAVTQIGPGMLLVNPAWVDASIFAGFEIITIHPSEPFAANALLLNSKVIYPTTYSATRLRLRQADLDLFLIDASELAKAEGGITCCSLIFMP